MCWDVLPAMASSLLCSCLYKYSWLALNTQKVHSHWLLSLLTNTIYTKSVKKNQQSRWHTFTQRDTSLANWVFNVRKVAFLMEGARARVTFHQMVLSAFTDPALVIVSLILLRMQHMFWMIVVQAGQAGMHTSTHQFLSVWFALHTVTHERVDHQDFSLKETDLQMHTSFFLLALYNVHYIQI